MFPEFWYSPNSQLTRDIYTNDRYHGICFPTMSMAQQTLNNTAHLRSLTVLVIRSNNIEENKKSYCPFYYLVFVSHIWVRAGMTVCYYMYKVVK